MKAYKVFYAGEPESAATKMANSYEEAAYLYFISNPKNALIFAEAGFSGEKMVSIEKLSDTFDDVPEILKNLELQGEAINEGLDSNAGLDQSDALDEQSRLNTELVRLSKVPLGISLIYYSLLLTIFAVVLWLWIAAVGRLLSKDPGVSPVTIVDSNPLFGLLIIVILGLNLMGLLGLCFCATAPNRIKANKAIYVVIFFYALPHVLLLPNSLGLIPEIIYNLGSFLSIFALVAFIFFLKNLGRFMNDSELARKSIELLWLMLIILVTFLVWLFVATLGSIVGSPVLAVVMMIIGLLMLILGLLGLINYARLLHSFKKALAGN